MPDCRWCSAWRFWPGNQENPTFPEGAERRAHDGGRRRDAGQRHAQYPKVFDDLTTNMVEAGETGGILDIILQRLAAYIEKSVKLRRAVKSH